MYNTMKKEDKQAHKWGWKTLHIAFIIGPITVGIDKFFNLIAYWPGFLAPQVKAMIPFSATQIMGAVGVIEILGGLIVWWKPRIGGFLIGTWMLAIIVNLLMGGYLTYAARDFLIAVAAFAFAAMSVKK